jgi:hypothetical protein
LPLDLVADGADALELRVVEESAAAVQAAVTGQTSSLLVETGFVKTKWRLAPPQHAKAHLLLDGDVIGYERESIRERLRNACPLPGGRDRQAVGTVVEGARNDEHSLVCQFVKARDDRLVDAVIDCVNRRDPLTHVEPPEL